PRKPASHRIPSFREKARRTATAGAPSATAERGAPRSRATSRAPAKSASEGCARRLLIVAVVGVGPLDEMADRLRDEDQRGAGDEAVERVEAEERLDAKVRMPLDERLGDERQDEDGDEELPEHVSLRRPARRAPPAGPRRRT